jgi:hypothetical protein
VCWRTEVREGKPTKVPYTPGTLRRASSTDLMSWRTFSEALEAYESGEPPYDGIGFVFCSADPYVGVDLDNCRDPEVGTVAEWAQKIIDSFADSYVEASPSGTGVHIIFEGTLKDGAKKKKQSTGIEAYGQDRYRETGDDDNKNEARAEDRENKRAQSTEPALQGGLSQKKVREVLGEPAYYQGPARDLAEYREDPSAENLARLTRSIRFSLGMSTEGWERSVGVVRTALE